MARQQRLPHESLPEATQAKLGVLVRVVLGAMMLALFNRGAAWSESQERARLAEEDARSVKLDPVWSEAGIESPDGGGLSSLGDNARVEEEEVGEEGEEEGRARAALLARLPFAPPIFVLPEDVAASLKSCRQLCSQAHWEGDLLLTARWLSFAEHAHVDEGDDDAEAAAVGMASWLLEGDAEARRAADAARAVGKDGRLPFHAWVENECECRKA